MPKMLSQEVIVKKGDILRDKNNVYKYRFALVSFRPFKVVSFYPEKTSSDYIMISFHINVILFWHRRHFFPPKCRYFFRTLHLVF